MTEMDRKTAEAIIADKIKRMSRDDLLILMGVADGLARGQKLSADDKKSA